MIKAITFDFWYTLYESKPTPQAARQQFIKTAIEAKIQQTLAIAQLQKAIGVARETWDRVWVHDHRTLDAHEWITIVLKELGLSLSETAQMEITRQIEDTIFDHWPTVAPEAKTILPKLAAQYPLAIISDTGLTPGRALKQILVQDGLADYFTHFTFSDQLGSSKPHSANFLTTLQALNAEPHEAVHIGDILRTDVFGAKGVGMYAVQYVGLREDTTGFAATPDAVIASHTELKTLLQQW